MLIKSGSCSVPPSGPARSEKMPASTQLALTIAYDKVRRGGGRPWKGSFSDCWEATGATGNVKPQILAPQQVMHDGVGAGCWGGEGTLAAVSPPTHMQWPKVATWPSALSPAI